MANDRLLIDSGGSVLQADSGGDAFYTASGDGVDNIILRSGGSLLLRFADRTIQLEDGTALLDESGNDVYLENGSGAGGVILLRGGGAPPAGGSLPVFRQYYHVLLAGDNL